MDRREAVSKFLNRVINEGYRTDQKAKGIYASGRSAQSPSPEAGIDFGRILGSHYFAYQRSGRRPGGFPPVEAIMDWIKAKGGFTWEGNRGLRGLAFAIANKIAKRGTDIFLRKRPGLSIEDRILEARKEFAMNLLAEEKRKAIEKIEQLKRK